MLQGLKKSVNILYEYKHRIKNLNILIKFLETSKAPEPIPEPEVPKDPATDPIAINKETNIELNAENKPLGIVVVKGDSSQIQVTFVLIILFFFLNTKFI